MELVEIALYVAAGWSGASVLAALVLSRLMGAVRAPEPVPVWRERRGRG